MLAFMEDWLKNLIVVIIMISMIKIVLPAGQIRNYVRLVVSLVVILLIIEPLIQAVKGADYLLDSWLSNQNIISFEENRVAAKINTLNNQELALDIYKEKLISQLEYGLTNLLNTEVQVQDVVVEEDINDESFGCIKSIDLAVTKTVAEVMAYDEQEQPTGINDDHTKRDIEKWLLTQYGSSIRIKLFMKE